MRSNFLFALIVLSCATFAFGVDAPSESRQKFPPYIVANSQLRALPRSADGFDYVLMVFLPESYATRPKKRYPVLYTCDGYWDSVLVNALYGNLIYDRVAPEFIIVGFSYPGPSSDYGMRRTYDYTPVPHPDVDRQGRGSGHAPEFLSVVEREFIPFIEREYRVDPSYRVLGGSSLGGLFTLYAMFTKPQLFQAYIAISPAVAWADEWLLDCEKQFAKSGQPLRVRLFMTGAAEEDPVFLGSIKKLNTQLAAHRYRDLKYQWRLIDGEGHAGTKAESYNRGLRFAFAPLK